MMFADLDKSIEVEVTELPEPVNGFLYEAHLQYFQWLPFTRGEKSSEYIGRFESVQEATDYARNMVKEEAEKRRKNAEISEIKKRYVSKTTYRIHN